MINVTYCLIHPKAIFKKLLIYSRVSWWGDDIEVEASRYMVSSRQRGGIIWWWGWGAVSILRQGSFPHWASSDGFLQWWRRCCGHVPWDQDCILKGFYSGPILGCLQDVLTVCFPVIVLVERVGRVFAVIVGILRVVACTRCFWWWTVVACGRCDGCGRGLASNWCLLCTCWLSNWWGWRSGNDLGWKIKNGGWIITPCLMKAVMIQPPFFIFHHKSFPLCCPYQPLSQHVHSKHQFDARPLPASPYHLHHRQWIYTHPVPLVSLSLTSCLSQMSPVLRTLTCTQPPVPPKPSTFGKPSTMLRSMPLRPEIEPHHRCQWTKSQPPSHIVAKHVTPPPHPSHLPCAATVHHQKHLVHAATLRIPTMTTRTLPTRSTNTITGKHTNNTSCRHPRIGPL